MLSPCVLNRRRRSHSASAFISAENGHIVAKKRAHAHPPKRWDAGSWRRGKRHGREVSVRSDITPMVSCVGGPLLATTPKEFNLPMKVTQTRRLSRPPPWFLRSSESYSSLPRVVDFEDIDRIKSEALGDLHKSIVENGEGLVQRMREHERLRMNKPRGRGCHVSPPISVGSSCCQPWYLDEDEIQIVSVERPTKGDADGLESGESIVGVDGTDVAVAAVTLALANGAASINDYSIIPVQDLAHSLDAGELWI